MSNILYVQEYEFWLSCLLQSMRFFPENFK